MKRRRILIALRAVVIGSAALDLYCTAVCITCPCTEMTPRSCGFLFSRALFISLQEGFLGNAFNDETLGTHSHILAPLLEGLASEARRGWLPCMLKYGLPSPESPVTSHQSLVPFPMLFAQIHRSL